MSGEPTTEAGAERAFYSSLVAEAFDNGIAAERARWADWLASEVGYPFDVTFSDPPPMSAHEMAEAWHRQDPSESVDDWFIAVSGEGASTRAAKGD